MDQVKWVLVGALKCLLRHQEESRSLVNATNIRELATEIVLFGKSSDDCSSFHTASVFIVCLEHDFNLVSWFELVPVRNNKSDACSGDILNVHLFEFFRYGKLSVFASKNNFFDWAVKPFIKKGSPSVFPKFKKDKKTVSLFALNPGFSATSLHFSGIHFVASSATLAKDDCRVVPSNTDFLTLSFFCHRMCFHPEQSYQSRDRKGAIRIGITGDSTFLLMEMPCFANMFKLQATIMPNETCQRL